MINNVVMASDEQAKGLSQTYTNIHSPLNYPPGQVTT